MEAVWKRRDIFVSLRMFPFIAYLGTIGGGITVREK
jgi:hypothetical protein